METEKRKTTTTKPPKKKSIQQINAFICKNQHIDFERPYLERRASFNVSSKSSERIIDSY